VSGTRRVAIATAAAAGAAAVAYGAYTRTDAYRRGSRMLSGGDRPVGPGRTAGRLWSSLADRGLTPAYVVTLETTGSRSGKSFSIPVVLAGFGGHKYVVSMLGERTPWVRNVRAAEGRAVIRHGDARDVILVEVPAEERAPILREYVRREAGARPHFPVEPDAPLEEYARIAADYPVFRVDQAG
jgi:deazaflavin-dependent oxidoreductase (nitroreductase family)